jgi:hypothetical protein
LDVKLSVLNLVIVKKKPKNKTREGYSWTDCSYAISHCLRTKREQNLQTLVFLKKQCWLMPVILATQQAEINPRKQFVKKTYDKKKAGVAQDVGPEFKLQ